MFAMLGFMKRERLWTIVSILCFESVHAFDNIFSANASSQCYFPDGAFSTGQACTPDAPISLCCGPGYSCLSNGICQATATAANHSSQYFRPTCTDQSWSSPNCPQFCTGSEDNRQSGQRLEVCDLVSGTYCCKRDFNCCTNSTLTFTLGHGTQAKVIPPITDQAATSSTNTMSNSTMSMSGDGSTGSGASPVGLGIGLTVLILALLASAAFYYMRRRKRRRHDAVTVAIEEPKSMDTPASASTGFSILKGASEASSVISAPIELGNLDNPRVPGAIRQYRVAAASNMSTTTSPETGPPSIPPRNPARMTLRSRDSSLEKLRRSESGRSRPSSVVAAETDVDPVLPIVREDARQEALATLASQTQPPASTVPSEVRVERMGVSEESGETSSLPQESLVPSQPPQSHHSMEITEVPRQHAADDTAFQRRRPSD